MKPFLKWAGGKQKLIEQYKPHLPTTLSGRTYIEPFLGGGAIALYVIENLKPSNVILSDYSPELINAWKVLQNDVNKLIEVLESYDYDHNQRYKMGYINDEQRKNFYREIRKIQPTDYVDKAAKFIYLNKTCFNGMYRVNSKNEFNIPMGKYEYPTIFNEKKLKEISNAIQNVTITWSSYTELEDVITDNCFIYLDPPYHPISKTSNFVGYTKKLFNEDDQIELRNILGKINNANWMLSNSVCPFIDELYSDSNFNKYKVLAARSINSKASKRGKIEEFVIKNY